MKDFRKDADSELVRLWNKLAHKGFKPIERQFQFLMGKQKGDLLNSIRSGWKNYCKDANNFKADGRLKRKMDLFPVYLSSDQPRKKKDDPLDSINFSLDFSPENGLHIADLYLLRISGVDDITEINIKHRPNEPPSVKDLNRLMENTDKERIRKNEGSIIKEVDMTKARKMSLRI